jgi:uncharacterized protein YyaL (SSP411 family)
MNRLANETSPYLLQHKDNPVDWYAWGDEAFAAARAADKPILLSVGYSACHWCHVMAHESFENAETAALMNEGFINIKVDREERPDVDAVYMQAVQALTGRGGWPMTVFLTPAGLPFYGGTYFPPEDRYGMPAFARVLQAVGEAFRDRRSDLETAGEQVRTHLTPPALMRGSTTLLTTAVLTDAVSSIGAAFDPAFGGFGQAPKFPPSMTLDFLLRHCYRTHDADVLDMVEKTLVAMAQGGMYDQVGGGFHRYSTDAVWLVPHFEKMLYDNALLARVYLDAFKVTGEPFYRRIVEETLDYVLREMTDASGGFYSSQDADSEGEEGKFFVWTLAELEAVLGEDAALMAAYFGASAEGNFHAEAGDHAGEEAVASNILHVAGDPEALATEHNLPPEALDDAITSAKAKLFAAREQRVHPGRDDKVITAWNGMMLRAFAEAGFVLDQPRYLDAAVRNATFLLEEMRPEGRLLRTWKRDAATDTGVAKINAYLEDHALLIDGLLATYQASFEARFLDAAVELTDAMLYLFWDEGVEGFYDTGRDHESLITRPRDFFDNATPSGTSVAADVLLRLAAITGNEDYQRRAVTVIRALTPLVEQAPTMFGRLLAATDYYLSRSQELAIVLPASAGRADPADGRILLDAIREAYLPNLILAGGVEGAAANTPLLQERTAIDGQPTAYLCEHFVCQMPATSPEELLRQLGVS